MAFPSRCATSSNYVSTLFHELPLGPGFPNSPMRIQATVVEVKMEFNYRESNLRTLSNCKYSVHLGYHVPAAIREGSEEEGRLALFVLPGRHEGGERCEGEGCYTLFSFADGQKDNLALTRSPFLPPSALMISPRYGRIPAISRLEIK